MKKILSFGILFSTLTLASCSTGSETSDVLISESTDENFSEVYEEVTMIQVISDVSVDDINKTLEGLYESGFQVLEVQPSSVKETSGYVRSTYNIVYERNE